MSYILIIFQIEPSPHLSGVVDHLFLVQHGFYGRIKIHTGETHPLAKFT